MSNQQSDSKALRGFNRYVNNSNEVLSFLPMGEE